MRAQHAVVLPLFVFPCLAFQMNAEAQTATIKVRGAVRDAVTDAPIANARIFIIERAEEVRSAPNGFFVLDDVTPGQLRLVVSAFGYVEERSDREIAQGDVVLIKMTPEPVEVGGVSADVARNRLGRRRVALNSPFRDYGPEVLDFAGAPSLNDFVRERSTLQLRRFGRELCYHLGGDLPGRYYRLPIYLDDAPISHDVFWELRPSDIGLLEVFNRIPMARAYTKRFLEDVSTGRLQVMPLAPQQHKSLC